MGNLPKDRVTPAKAFLHCGVDYAGPFMVKPIKGRIRTILKTYIAVFVCLVTRAIHLELVMDLTTEAFIAAFRRFTSRRGRCARIYSDNATNFVGANRELKNYILQQSLDCNFQDPMIKEGVGWHFIPPASPHFGGIWEAAVKSLKHHLRRSLEKHTLSIEEMLTLVTQVEACLNSRPLSAITDDPDDLSLLTPSQSLIDKNLKAFPTPCSLEMPKNLLNRWQLVQHLYQHLWSRWYKEYLANLQLRNKWQRQQAPIALNELVLIKDDHLPPTRWLLGRVTELHPGTDGPIRVVTLRTKDGTLKRPITKLCVLPLGSTSQVSI